MSETKIVFNLPSSFDDLDLVFFDVETTGLNPEKGDSICEIGSIKVRNKKVLDMFHTLINPKRNIPLQVQAIHGISNEDVKDSPCFKDIADKLLSFLDNALLCGYNVGFDLSFLNWELKRINYPFIELPSLDILVMSKRTIPDLNKYNLASLVEYLQIDNISFHRALGDAIATKEIFFKLKNILERKGIIRPQDFITLYGFDNDFFRKNQQPKISLMRESILANISLKVDYLSYNSDIKTLVVIPKELMEDKGRIYLLGLFPDREDMVKLNFTRILNVEII
ncbi:MAG: exonuclease domain-containing protein [Candidatus Omnitrophica bacterium]|nr:exonuclease domain-containing protein [Candidatus Omnitrophota bacterium]